VVVAVIAVRVVEPSLDQVVDVIAVGHLLVATAIAVRVGRSARDRRRVAARMRLIHGDHVFIHVTFVRVMEVAVVEVVDVIVVANGGVTAVRSMLVLVGAFVGLMGHGSTLRRDLNDRKC
jgi:hypothetical protein